MIRKSYHRIIAILTAPLLLLSCTLSAQGITNGAVLTDRAALSALLDSTVFFGESTTAHLSRHGGVLDTDQWRNCVWRDVSGTRQLDRRLLSTSVLYKGHGAARALSVAEALTREQPRRIILSFGLNGLVSHAKDPDRFLRTYRFVLDGIKERSPETKIYVQSIYPVGENDVFSDDTATVNRYIRTLNAALLSACRAWGDVAYLDTASLLCDDSGTLASIFDTGDGIHLTNDAYLLILSFLSEHLGALHQKQKGNCYESITRFIAAVNSCVTTPARFLYERNKLCLRSLGHRALRGRSDRP